MLDQNLKDQLQQHLQKMVSPVQVELVLDNSVTSAEIKQLWQDIEPLSALISVTERQAAEHARHPAFYLSQENETARICFAGLPMGHEFTSLILAILQTGGYAPKLDPSLIQQIQQLTLEDDLYFESTISMSCQICPEVVQVLNALAVLHPRIHHTMIDGSLFEQHVQDKKIMAVPTVHLNGEAFSQGMITIEDVLAKLDRNAEHKQTAALANKAPFDMLIVGGGPAGAAAAIYAARKGIRTGVVSERFGGQVLDTLAIENFISVTETEGPKMARALEQHVRHYDVDIMNRQRAEKLQQHQDHISITLASGAELKSKSVVLATGARWREMNVPGEQEYRGRGVAYCPHCDGPLFKGKRVAVIGGGNSGIEAAIDLAGIVSHVTVLEFDHKLRADAVLQNKLNSLANVTVITSAQTTEVIGDGQKVSGLRYTDRNQNQNHELALEGIFVQIGLLPNTTWLQDSITLSARGEIVVDERGATSMAGVFAAGDATTVPYKQIIIAMGDGAKASLSAFDYLIRQTA